MTRARASVRMPLQSGATSARLLATGVAGILGWVLALFFVGLPLLTRFDWLVLGAVVVVLVGLVFTLVKVRTAWLVRASDVVIDGESVVIVGGPHHGRRWALAECGSLRVAPATTTVIERATALTIAGTQLALAEDDDERDSLTALATALRGQAASRDEAPVVDAGVQRCASCGAPVVPVDAAQATCRACGAATAMPEPLRAKLRVAAALHTEQGRREAMVRRLLDQPDARAANQATAGLAALILLGLAAMVGGIFYQVSTADSYRIVTLLALLEVPFLITFAAYLLVRLRIVDRVALGLLTLDLAARRDPFGVAVCHSCGGPLPDTTDRAAVQCAYCGADNVLGIALAGRVDAAKREVRDLTRVLADRWRSRRRCLLGGVIAAAVAVQAGLSIAQGFEHNRSTDSTEPGALSRDIGEFGVASHSAAARLDGAWTVIVEAPEDLPPRLRLVDTHAGVLTEKDVLVAAKGLRDPSWRGQDVVFVADDDEGAALSSVPAAGGAVSVLHRGQGLESPSATADGELVVFAELRDGAWLVAALEGGAVRVLTPGRRPRVEAFGRQVVFLRAVDGLDKPFTLELVEGAQAKSLFEPNRWSYGDPVYSPCGGWIALTTNMGWDALRTGTELTTANLLLVSPTADAQVWLTQGNAAVRHPTWAAQTIYYDTDGHPDGQRRVYAISFGGAPVGELYEDECRERLAPVTK